MLALTLLDGHYGSFEKLTLALAEALAAQRADMHCACVQVDEANIPVNPSDGPLAAEAINRVLDAVRVGQAVHFCFGNYGGQSIQRGTWAAMLDFHQCAGPRNRRDLVHHIGRERKLPQLC